MVDLKQKVMLFLLQEEIIKKKVQLSFKPSSYPLFLFLSLALKLKLRFMKIRSTITKAFRMVVAKIPHLQDRWLVRHSLNIPMEFFFYPTIESHKNTPYLWNTWINKYAFCSFSVKLPRVLSFPWWCQPGHCLFPSI